MALRRPGLLVLPLCLAIFSPFALAKSCIEVSLTEQLKYSSDIFTAKVLAVSSVVGHGAKVRVTKVYKGSALGTVIVHTSVWGPTPKKGRSYLFTVNKVDDRPGHYELPNCWNLFGPKAMRGK
jgi:hypothetical protein